MKATLLTLGILACVVTASAVIVGIPHPIPPVQQKKTEKQGTEKTRFIHWSKTL